MPRKVKSKAYRNSSTYKSRQRGEAIIVKFLRDLKRKNPGALFCHAIPSERWRKLAVKGVVAWFMHRGYHGLAMPMWERKLRVFGGWVGQFFLRRDVVGTSEIKFPRVQFETFASRPKA